MSLTWKHRRYQNRTEIINGSGRFAMRKRLFLSGHCTELWLPYAFNPIPHISTRCAIVRRLVLYYIVRCPIPNRNERFAEDINPLHVAAKKKLRVMGLFGAVDGRQRGRRYYLYRVRRLRGRPAGIADVGETTGQ